MHIIGLHGYTGTGKDTIAAHLVSKGWKRVAFADPVREMLYTINPIIGRDVGCDLRLQHTIDGMGWDASKRLYPEVRTLLQRMGTDACRKTFGSDCFAMIAAKKIREAWKFGCPGVVVTDVRYDVEAEVLLDESLGGAMIFEVTRPGFGPINSHCSESGLNRSFIAETIANDCDVGGLNASVDRLLIAYRMA